jgi:superfamily II DNA or RNA helicase
MLTEIYDNVDSDSTGQARAYDILIVDEAAHVAPASPQNTSKERRGYAIDTQRTIAVRELAQRCENRMFLTATPHNGYTESFTALLEMIDDRRFVRGAIVDQKSLSEVVVRRLKKDLTEAGVRKFPPRKVMAISFTPSEEELNAYKKLDEFLERRKAQLKKAKVSDMATLLLKKRFLSSPLAFAYTVDNYLASRGLSIDEVSDYDEVLGERADEQEEGLIDQEESIALRADIGAGLELSKKDRDELGELSKWGRSYLGKPDSRLQALLGFLNENLRDRDNEINNERVVIFSEYVDTINWIKSTLDSFGYGDDRVAVIIGSTESEDREEIKARFQAEPSEQALRILLATDAAGEGIDLQNFCHRLVNFDIPFNPNRLEQRAGRIDRYGQNKDPEIYHFGASSESGIGYAGDIEMLARVLRKVVQQIEDLGSVNQIISDEIQSKLIGRKSPADGGAAKGKQSSKVLKKDDLVIAKMMLGEREVRSELTQLESQLEDTLNRLHVRPENLRRVVDTALKMDHQAPLKGKIDKRSGSTVYEVPKLSLNWQPALKLLATRLDPNNQRHITFDPSIAEGRQDLVLVHLGHLLVQHSARILRAALWRPDSELNRITAVSIRELKDPVVAALCRLVLVGKGGIRLHEEVFLAGVRLKGKALGEEASETLLEESLDGKNLASLSARQQAEIVEIWNSKSASGDISSRLKESIELRKSKRLKEVSVLLQDRKKLDIERVEEIFKRFDDVLLASLKLAEEESDVAEGQLFPEEKLQRSKDVAKWRERRAMLESEKLREIVKVGRRYEEIQPYEFTAALVFAYPQEDSK